jgi:glycerol-3-phosphate acyltransferase PlsY
MTDFFREALLPINLLFYFFAYALAATPTSYLVARRVHGLDIKKNQRSLHSSLYIWRNISKKSGLLVFVLDSLKGIIPCAIAYSLMTPPAIIALIGYFAVIGHCYSPWIYFSGGRGAATAAGAMLFVYWPASVFGYLFFLLLLALGFSAHNASFISIIIALGVIFLGVANKLVWMIVALMGITILLCHRRHLRAS